MVITKSAGRPTFTFISWWLLKYNFCIVFISFLSFFFYCFILVRQCAKGIIGIWTPGSQITSHALLTIWPKAVGPFTVFQLIMCTGHFAKGIFLWPNGEFACLCNLGVEALCALSHWCKIYCHWTKLISMSLFTGLSSHIITFGSIVCVLKIKLHLGAIFFHCFLFNMAKVLFIAQCSDN